MFKNLIIGLSFIFAITIAQAQIPNKFFGKWAPSKKSCVEMISPNSFSEDGFEVSSKGMIIGMETACTLTKLVKTDDKYIHANFKCMTEGETISNAVELRLLEQNKLTVKINGQMSSVVKCMK